VLDQLQRDALLELAVSALAEVNAPHSATADLAHDAKWPDAIRQRTAEGGGGFEDRSRERDGRRLEKAVGVMISAEQLVHFVAQPIVSLGSPVDERRLGFRGKIDDGIEDGIDAPEPFGR